MGYYTYYSMEARNIKNKDQYETIVAKLQEFEIMSTSDRDGAFDNSKYNETSNIAYFEAYDDCKWYEHTYDMMKFSKLFPDVTFELTGEGEERDDLWKEYYHNGESEVCRAKIIWETPIFIKWD